MRGFYTNGLDAEAAAEVTLADVADMPRPRSTSSSLPLREDPFENTEADDVPAPF
jgi:hypothetical protein